MKVNALEWVRLKYSLPEASVLRQLCDKGRRLVELHEELQFEADRKVINQMLLAEFEGIFLDVLLIHLSLSREGIDEKLKESVDADARNLLKQQLVKMDAGTIKTDPGTFIHNYLSPPMSFLQASVFTCLRLAASKIPGQLELQYKAAATSRAGVLPAFEKKGTVLDVDLGGKKKDESGLE